MKRIGWEEMRSLYGVSVESGGPALEYGASGTQGPEGQESAFMRQQERERLREELVPFIREQVKRTLREERDYFKSRPSLAAKYYGELFPAGPAQRQVTLQVTKQVCSELETRLRREWLRKGGG